MINKSTCGLVLLLTILFNMILAIRSYSQNDYNADYLKNEIIKGNYKPKFVLRKIRKYAEEMIQTIPDSVSMNNYYKCIIHIAKRNPTFWSIPSMFNSVRNGERHYFSEWYSHDTYCNGKEFKSFKQLSTSTTYRRRTTLENVYPYLKPNIYNVTILEDCLLSPFRKQNSKFYIYHNVKMENGLTKLTFKPKVKNTQLVSGGAIVEDKTGRILKYEIEGEYDMCRFSLKVDMGDKGYKTLFAKNCFLKTKLSYLGNKVYGDFTTYYDRSVTLPDSLKNVDDIELMKQVRPTPLTAEEQEILNAYNNQKYSAGKKNQIQSNSSDSVENDRNLISGKSHSSKQNIAKYILWDIIGDNMLHRITAKFGEKNEGNIRLGPIFNPLYLGYNRNKGLYYKLNMKGEYQISDNSFISINIKGGYSFRNKIIYYTIPLTYMYDNGHNAYVKVVYDNGNRITSSTVLDKIKNEQNRRDIDITKYQLDYFKDMIFRIVSNYDINEKFGIQAGLDFHRRKAVHPNDFRTIGKPVKYSSFAPLIQFQYRPTGYKGVILTGDYEHSFEKVFGSDIKYDRWEFDASYLKPLPCMRSLSIKAGIGFYTFKSGDLYFLDYSNFRDNNIPGGWNDDWSGEFELLHRDWYNASDYYIRWNSTYESPLMVLSWVPIVGQIVEKERIYFSALAVRKYYPYLECGYGFTNRVFSMGIFSGFSNRHFEGVGFKFGLELFNNW